MTTLNIIGDGDFNVLYKDGALLVYGKSDHVDAETLHYVLPLVLPEAEVSYTYMPICDILQGDAPPQELTTLMVMADA